ncbi:MAG TPA: response regulator [Gemmatimonadales bacterium]
MTPPGTAPVILIAVTHEQRLARVLEGYLYSVVQAHTATLAHEWAREVRPDAIILESDLPDMSGIELCRALHADPRIGHSVPILILAAGQPTPEQRVAALRAGAWDFLSHSEDPEELALKLQTYVQAKHNMDVALAEGLVDPVTGLHSRLSLARRARELGALMARKHGSLACVVFVLDADPVDQKAARLVAQTTRISDIVGTLSPAELVVLAPATDHAGAVKLAHRVAGTLHEGIDGERPIVPGLTLRAGYEAVVNLGYSPTDPVELLARASAAVRTGAPDASLPWVRAFDPARTSGPSRMPVESSAGAGLVPASRRSRS